MVSKSGCDLAPGRCSPQKRNLRNLCNLWIFNLCHLSLRRLRDRRRIQPRGCPMGIPDELRFRLVWHSLYCIEQLDRPEQRNGIALVSEGSPWSRFDEFRWLHLRMSMLGDSQTARTSLEYRTIVRRRNRNRAERPKWRWRSASKILFSDAGLSHFFRGSTRIVAN